MGRISCFLACTFGIINEFNRHLLCTTLGRRSLLKGPPPSFRSITATLVSRVIPKSKLPHSHVCTDEFTQTGATYYITIFRFPEGSCSSPQVHRRRKLLESTEGGSCSSPQKEEVDRVLRRRKLLESTEGGSRSNPQMEEAARVHRGRKLSNHDARTPGQVFRIWVPRVHHSQWVPDVKKTECNTKCMRPATEGNRSRFQVPGF